MNEYHSAHAVYSLSYHIVLVTKYRRKVLTGDVAEHLKSECIRLVEDKKGNVQEIEINEDYVHILADLSPCYSVVEIINSLKGVTSRILRRDHLPEISRLLHGDSLWSDSYYISTTGGVTIERLKAYVQSQPTEEHKRKYVKSGKYSKYHKKKRNSYPA